MSVFQSRLTPTEAEVYISVYPEQLTASTEVRGRLMGPRCPYATTVEVAYPLREWKRHYEKEDVPHFLMRVIIPEPNMWDPQSPFLYEGPVGLWQGKERCDQIVVSRGLRTVNLGSRGISWNGRVVTVFGIQLDNCNEEEARHLHQQGCNTFLMSGDSPSDALWQIADRIGFLMLRRIESRQQVAQVDARVGHPSRLGWVLGQAMLDDPLIDVVPSALLGDGTDGGCLLGVELFEKPATPLPVGIQFVVCAPEVLPLLSDIALPKLLLRDGTFLEEGHAGKQEPPEDTLGSIYCR